MSVAPTLIRLQSIRRAEEQQCRTMLDAAAAELDKFREMLASLKERLRRSRALITASVRTGVVEDRLAALGEDVLLGSLTRVLAAKIVDAEQCVLQARSQLLDKRIERRQVETLLEAVRLQAGIDESRKSQSAMDEWFRARAARERHAPDPPVTSRSSSGGVPQIHGFRDKI